MTTKYDIGTEVMMKCRVEAIKVNVNCDIDFRKLPTSAEDRAYRQTLMSIKEKLDAAGVKTNYIVTCNKDLENINKIFDSNKKTWTDFCEIQ